MSEEQICATLQTRWSDLEDRARELNDLMLELEQVDNDDNAVTRTGAYRLMALEHRLLNREIDFINDLLGTINQK
ncbi:hypothetical protein [Paenibacillus apiarius]|uniref:hypothetical protein n=1 Tax=Paenibacillus apiarius TaxID=46240 RepID=UPI003B3B19AD